MFKCPYCNQDSYSRKKAKFNSWRAIKNHTVSCVKNNHEYYISEIYGPIHFTELLNKTSRIIRQKYPDITQLSTIKSNFKVRNIGIIYTSNLWTKETILLSIKQFYQNHNRIPISRDFTHNVNFPEASTVQNHFGSWNAAIKAAGFVPNLGTSDLYGTPTIAKDNVLYRSKAEAYFVDNYLYGKYIYEYERKYDNHNKYYDFYLPESNLYIELDGQLRPEIIQEKILINKQENKKLLVIQTDDIYKKDFILKL